MKNELFFYYNLIHKVYAAGMQLTGEQLQLYTVKCMDVDKKVRQTWFKVLGNEENGDLYLIRYFRQRRQVIIGLSRDLEGVALASAGSIFDKRLVFLGKMIKRHLVTLERMAKEMEIQLHLGAVQELHDAVSIRKAGGKRFLQFLSAN